MAIRGILTILACFCAAAVFAKNKPPPVNIPEYPTDLLHPNETIDHTDRPARKGPPRNYCYMGDGQNPTDHCSIWDAEYEGYNAYLCNNTCLNGSGSCTVNKTVSPIFVDCNYDHNEDTK